MSSKTPSNTNRGIPPHPAPAEAAREFDKRVAECTNTFDSIRLMRDTNLMFTTNHAAMLSPALSAVMLSLSLDRLAKTVQNVADSITKSKAP